MVVSKRVDSEAVDSGSSQNVRERMSGYVLRVFLMARAKRERVVQDEVEKANRRPTDPTRHDTAGTPHSFFEI